MINKITNAVAQALGEVAGGATVINGGFGAASIPIKLTPALINSIERKVAVVNHNAGNGFADLAGLLAGRVRKMLCSFRRTADSWVLDQLSRAGSIELELVPQGNLIEHIRAAGAGIGALFSPTSYGSPPASLRTIREITGWMYVIESATSGNIALSCAQVKDHWGHLSYRRAEQYFSPVMATPAKRTVTAVQEVCKPGALVAESIVMPGIFVHLLVAVAQLPTAAGSTKQESSP